MKVSDFDYELPEELIAQDPLEDRSSSRLLVMDKTTGELTHKHFSGIIDYLMPGDKGNTGKAFRSKGRHRSPYRDTSAYAQGGRCMGMSCASRQEAQDGSKSRVRRRTA